MVRERLGFTHGRPGGTVRVTRYGFEDDHGFTVMELMVIVLIIGILLSMAIATYVPASRSAAAAACRSNQRVLEKAYMAAVIDADSDASEESSESPLPVTDHSIDEIDDLAAYVDNLDRIERCPLDDSALTLDPDTGDISCPNHP